MEKEELLFIGGLLDGHRIKITKDLTSYTLPFSPERLLLKTYLNPPVEAPTPRKRHTWNRVTRGELSVMVYSGTRFKWFESGDKLHLLVGGD